MTRNLSMQRSVYTCAAAILLVGALNAPNVAAGADELVVTPQDIQETVSLAINPGADGSITGLLKNNGTVPVRNVRLLIRHSWLWKNERNPGNVADNPARAAYYVVDGVVPAGGELKFRYSPSPLLPARADGHFVTSASIVGLTEVTPDEDESGVGSDE